MSTLEEDCSRAEAIHGRLCVGMVMAIRMARFACARLGLTEPRKDRNFVIFVETARCAADAAYAVTGLTLGSRRLKLVDQGKMAMTIADGRNGRGVRVHCRPVLIRAPDGVDPVAFLAGFPDDELFDVREVVAFIPPEEWCRPPLRVVACTTCGEKVFDGRERLRHGTVLCESCAAGAYYRPADRSAELAPPPKVSSRPPGQTPELNSARGFGEQHDGRLGGEDV
jgi:formylmethanofuran dehydrogenase subunit E